MIQEMMVWYKDMMAVNPTFATLIGAGLGGWLLMSLRQVPVKVFALVRGQLVTSLTMNNSGHGPNEDQCIGFMNWFGKQPLARFSRRLSMNSAYNGTSTPTVDIGSGFGIHVFFYKGRLFWFNKAKLDSAGTHLEKFEIVIHGLTRNTQLLKELVEEFRLRGSTETVNIVPWDGMRWGDSISVTKRPIHTVIMNREKKEMILGKIEEFFEGRAWYEERGMPYKMCAMLSGPPGTGKTSIAKAISSHFGRNVYTLSLSSLTDDLLQRAVTTMPAGSVLLIEDFDTNNAVQNRAIKKLEAHEEEELQTLIIRCNLEYDYDNSQDDKFLWIMDGGHRVGYEKGNPLQPWIFFQNSGIIDDVPCDGPSSVTDFPHRSAPFMRIWELHDRSIRGGDGSSNSQRLTLSGLLNSLDGIVPLDGSLIFLTTNHPEHLDPALVRKGRIDHQWEVDLLEDPEIRDYIDLMFPKVAVHTDVRFKPIAGCDLQALFHENRNDAVEFIRSIPKDIV